LEDDMTWQDYVEQRPDVMLGKPNRLRFSIASEYGTSVEELVTLNPAIDPTNLQVGQTIRVP